VRRKILKKYEDKNNVIGNLIKDYRTNANLSKTEVSKQLQLHAVYIDRTELNRMETGKMIVKDFELIALCKVLKIPFDKLLDLIE
jgi:transcriptional regulator with XRE-family HTH domain